MSSWILTFLFVWIITEAWVCWSLELIISNKMCLIADSLSSLTISFLSQRVNSQSAMLRISRKASVPTQINHKIIKMRLIEFRPINNQCLCVCVCVSAVVMHPWKMNCREERNFTAIAFVRKSWVIFHVYLIWFKAFKWSAWKFDGWLEKRIGKSKNGFVTAFYRSNQSNSSSSNTNNSSINKINALKHRILIRWETIHYTRRNNHRVQQPLLL